MFGDKKDKEKEDKKLAPDQIEKFKAILEEIGTHKTRGFIFMIKAEGARDEAVPVNDDIGQSEGDGLLFANGTSRPEIFLNLWENCNLNDKLRIAHDLMKSMKEEKD